MFKVKGRNKYVYSDKFIVLSCSFLTGLLLKVRYGQSSETKTIISSYISQNSLAMSGR